ncbi:hypothetical protein D3C87_80950 [compost metagenome]
MLKEFFINIDSEQAEKLDMIEVKAKMYGYELKIAQSNYPCLYFEKDWIEAFYIYRNPIKEANNNWIIGADSDEYFNKIYEYHQTFNLGLLNLKTTEMIQLISDIL